MFLIKCIKQPSDNLNIYSYISFVSSCTKASSSKKLKHKLCWSTSTKHFCCNRIVPLRNALPPIDTSKSYASIRIKIMNFLRDHFIANFNPDCPWTSSSPVNHAPIAHTSLAMYLLDTPYSNISACTVTVLSLNTIIRSQLTFHNSPSFCPQCCKVPKKGTYWIPCVTRLNRLSW